MKRYVCIMVVLLFIVSPIPAGCGRKGINKVTVNPLVEERKGPEIQWKETSVKASLGQYSVKKDLSDVVNISEFTDIIDEDRAMLSEKLFMIKKPSRIFEQPFDLYEKNAYDGIPNFITCDSMLHVYHLMVNYIIRNVEKERLTDELKAFTEGAFKKSVGIYNGTKESSAKKAALKNIAYFGIAMRLLGRDLPGGIPLEANRIIDNDVKKVKARWGSGTSEIFPYYLDYKSYLVRGHYSRENEFTNYYLTMMWYGNTPMIFEQYDTGTDDYKKADEQIAMSVIMTSQILGDESLKNLWDDMYQISTYYFGKSEALTIYDMSNIIKAVYGEKVDFNKVTDRTKIEKVYRQAKQKYSTRLMETAGGKINFLRKDYKPQVQFTLMGQINSLNNQVYGILTPDRAVNSDGPEMLPNGLDIPSALGSDLAYTLLNEVNKDNMQPDCSSDMDKIKGIFGKSKPKDFSLFDSVFWIVKGWNNPYKAGYPSFMKCNEYENKILMTSLSTISDARHLSTLAARLGEIRNSENKRPSHIEMPGYVEPDINLYSKLEYMAENMKTSLSSFDFINDDVNNALNSFTDLIVFLKDISVKELEDKPLNEEDKKRLQKFDMELKKVTMDMVSTRWSTKEWAMVPKVDRNIACVTDAYMGDSQVLQTAIGSPDYIYVIVPYEGKLYMARGSVYSYYEFTFPVSKKLKDNDWQDIVNEGKESGSSEWINKIRR